MYKQDIHNALRYFAPNIFLNFVAVKNTSTNQRKRHLCDKEDIWHIYRPYIVEENTFLSISGSPKESCVKLQTYFP